MNFLKQLNEGQQLAKLHGMPAKKIELAFLANYVAGLVILRAGDINGLVQIRPHGFNRLSNAMSPIDFWMYVLFVASRNELKKYLPRDVVDVIKKDAGYVIDSRVKKMADVFKTSADTLNWVEAVYSIKLMQVRLEIKLPTINTILRVLYDWQNSDAAERMNSVGQALRILMMADPSSPLVKSLRDITSSKKLFPKAFVTGAAVGAALSSVARVFKEDDAGAAGTPVETATADTTVAGAVATLPQLLFKNGKVIKRKKANWKRRVWKDPELSKKLGDYSDVRAA
jgi:hypothetical protein